MKKCMFMVVMVCLLLVSALTQAQPNKTPDRFLPRQESLRPEDLRVVRLEFSPDPVRQGQPLGFRITLGNRSNQSGDITLIIKDRDEIVSEARDVRIRPGENRIVFPATYYRFSRSDHCFTVEADIERTRRPIDVERQFCAQKVSAGWTLRERAMGPLYVEDLAFNPDPVLHGQEVRFRVRLRNEGRPIRGDIRIQDGDQLVVRVDNVSIPRGNNEFQFPNTRYIFQRFDHCFTVLVDFDRTPYRIDAARDFCAKPVGWSLKP